MQNLVLSASFAFFARAAITSPTYEQNKKRGITIDNNYGDIWQPSPGFRSCMSGGLELGHSDHLAHRKTEHREGNDSHVDHTYIREM